MTAPSPLFTAALVWLAVVSVDPAQAAEDSPADGAAPEDCGPLCHVWNTIGSFNAAFQPSDYGVEAVPAEAQSQRAEPSPPPKARPNAASSRAKPVFRRPIRPSTGPSGAAASAGGRSATPSRIMNVVMPAPSAPAPLPAPTKPASILPQGYAPVPLAGQALPGSAVIRPAGFVPSPTTIVQVAASKDQTFSTQRQP